jgi:hypothetical protein
MAIRLLAGAALLISTVALAQDTGKPKGLQARVWVNNITRIYHCPGSSYYGNTRSGEFMEEAQARGHGFRAVGSRGCRNAANAERAPLPDTSRVSKRMVWVNTESGTYHCPNAADWGTTRRGRYLNEADASTAGHKPAAGRKCDVRAK